MMMMPVVVARLGVGEHVCARSDAITWLLAERFRYFLRLSCARADDLVS